MNKFTSKEKQAYFKSLRDRWQEAKKLSETDQVAKALFQETGGNYSYISFYLTLMDMKAAGLDGVPYIDCKTYNGWKEAGFTVRKGEKSTIKGMTWIHPVSKDEKGNEVEDESSVYPKTYNLFHRTQVEEIK